MWALRLLSGPQAGLITPLSSGRNLIGRAPQCAIRLNHPGISKEHCEITIQQSQIQIKDLGSSNGTFVNGVRIQSGLVRLGDKIGLHDLYFDIIASIPQMSNVSQFPNAYPNAPHPVMMGNTALQTDQFPQMQQHPSATPAGNPNPLVQQGFVQGLISHFQEYMERVALPGVYRLPQLMEFKSVLLLFTAAFIFVVTVLSMFPMIQITKASIMNESKRRALSLARTLAQVNQQTLLQGSYNSLSTHSAETEDGVKQALIVQQNDGMVLAPASRQGQTPNLPFVHSARKEMKSQVGEIDSNTIGASFPIGGFDPNTGDTVVKAHAIIIYDIGSLAFDDGRAISLFMQTLIIASLVGLIIFYFMYKLIEYPIASLNAQLDEALRQKADSLEVKFQFPALQNLIGNINSLLTRYLQGGDSPSANVTPENPGREYDAEKFLELIHESALALKGDGTLLAGNSSFEQLTRINIASMKGQGTSSLPDMALQQNIDFLINKAKEVPQSRHTDQLEFNGNTYQIHCQAFTSLGGQIEFFIVILTRSSE